MSATDIEALIKLQERCQPPDRRDAEEPIDFAQIRPCERFRPRRGGGPEVVITKVKYEIVHFHDGERLDFLGKGMFIAQYEHLLAEATA